MARMKDSTAGGDVTKSKGVKQGSATTRVTMHRRGPVGVGGGGGVWIVSLPVFLLLLLLAVVPSAARSSWVTVPRGKVSQPAREPKPRRPARPSRWSGTPVSLGASSPTDDDKDGKDDDFWKDANPFAVDAAIPESLREEIYRAEAQTAAAQGRGMRLVGYGVVAFLGLLATGFNVFLTTLEEDLPLEDSIFASLLDNEVARWWLHTKLGGFVNFSLAAGCITLMEQEVLGQRQMALDIWKELDRRRQATQLNPAASPSTTTTTPKKKKKKKKLGLSEVVALNANKEEAVDEKEEQNPQDDKKQAKSLLSPLQDLYQEADQMAASQALLLNQQLENAGLLQKITDEETGLRVVGPKPPSDDNDDNDEEENDKTEKESNV